MLIFRAAFLYFSDSERRDVDRCDIPGREGILQQGDFNGGGLSVGTICTARVPQEEIVQHCLIAEANNRTLSRGGVPDAEVTRNGEALEVTAQFRP